jgi:hypothetical protein
MLKTEYRSVIKFLFKEGQSPAEIKKRLDAQWRMACFAGQNSKNEGQNFDVFCAQSYR